MAIERHNGRQNCLFNLLFFIEKHALRNMHAKYSVGFTIVSSFSVSHV